MKLIFHIGAWLIIFMLILLSIPLYKGVNTQGWLYDKVRSDPIRITSDGKYEYRLELLNLFQRNSRERLYLRDVSTGHERYIPININTKNLHALLIRDGGEWMWVTLSPTDDIYQYMLTTTEILRLPVKRFLVDVRRGTSTIIE